MADTYEDGELFVYVNGDRWELGKVKRRNNAGDGYFCWYSRGDTAANTPVRCMHKLANAGWTKVERDHEDQVCKLRELLQHYHTFLALAELAQPIGYVIAASGHPTLSVESLDRRYRELGIEVDDD